MAVRLWELLAVLLLTLRPALGEAARAHAKHDKQYPTTIKSVIQPIQEHPIGSTPWTWSPNVTSAPEPAGPCENPGQVVLRLSRVGIHRVSDGVVESSRVTHLHLDDNGITEVSASAFDMVPRLMMLDLSRNNISTSRLLWFGEHVGLRWLYLDDNKYRVAENSKLKKIHKPLTNLLTLSMKRSGITAFDVSLNDFAPQLSRLSLSGNEISSAEFLKVVPRTLKYLELDENKIKEVEHDWLPNGLTELTIARNKLKNLCARNCDGSSMSLAGLTVLKRLNVSRNEIAEIKADAFQDLVSLTSVDLSGNRIYQLQDDLWNRSWPVQELYLAENQLSKIPKLCFLQNLKKLDLSGNEISDVTMNNFCRVYKHLELLILRKNRIFEVDGNAFAMLPALRTLDLSDNLLTTVPQHLITNSLHKLLMRNNRVNTLENLGKETTYSYVLPLEELHLQDNPLLFIHTTWIVHHRLPYLRIMLKDQPPTEMKTDSTTEKEADTNEIDEF